MSEYPTTTSGAHGAGIPPGRADNAPPPDASLGELFSDLSQNVSELVRKETELAKAELRQTARSTGKVAGLYAGAGVAGHFVLLFLSLAAMVGLASWLGYGWSAVVVAVIWAIIAAIMAALGKKHLKAVKGMPQTAETIKDIPPTFNPQEETP
jgi:hypothetical protein